MAVSERKPVMPSQSLLQGKPYTKWHDTDIRKLFAKVKAEQQTKPANVRPIRKAK